MLIIGLIILLLWLLGFSFRIAGGFVHLLLVVGVVLLIVHLIKGRHNTSV